MIVFYICFVLLYICYLLTSSGYEACRTFFNLSWLYFIYIFFFIFPSPLTSAEIRLAQLFYICLDFFIFVLFLLYFLPRWLLAEMRLAQLEGRLFETRKPTIVMRSILGSNTKTSTHTNKSKFKYKYRHKWKRSLYNLMENLKPHHWDRYCLQHFQYFPFGFWRYFWAR